MDKRDFELFERQLGIDTSGALIPAKHRVDSAIADVARLFKRNEWGPDTEKLRLLDPDIEALADAEDLETVDPEYMREAGISCRVLLQDLLREMYYCEHEEAISAWAVYTLLKNECLSGSVSRVSSGDPLLQHACNLDPDGGGYLYLLNPCASLYELIEIPRRPCGRRDHLWLTWKSNEGLGPSGIRDRWNYEMDDEQRKSVVGTCWKKIATGERGRNVVKTALLKATQEVAEQESQD